MWSCPRCGARNGRDAEHCARCGMPTPLGDGGTTKTMDVPPIDAEPPVRERRASLPWVAIVVAVVFLLAIALLAVAVLIG